MNPEKDPEISEAIDTLAKKGISLDEIQRRYNHHLIELGADLIARETDVAKLKRVINVALMQYEKSDTSDSSPQKMLDTYRAIIVELSNRPVLSLSRRLLGT